MGLTTSTAYTFQVRAVNAASPGAASDSVTVTPVAEIEIWSATLTVGKNSDNEWYRFGGNRDNTKYGTLEPASFTYDDTTYNITGLISEQGGVDTLHFLTSLPLRLLNVAKLTVGGRSFSGSVASISSRGDGVTWSADPGLAWDVGDTVSVSLTATPPDAPSNFAAAASDGEATLSWDDPGNTSITKYQYRQKEGSGDLGNWTDMTGSGANTVAHTVTGLTNGNAYIFQVRGAVAALVGAASDSVTTVLPASPPCDLEASRLNGAVALAGSAPTMPG